MEDRTSAAEVERFHTCTPSLEEGQKGVYKLQRNITAQRTWKGTRSSFAGEVASSD